MIRTMLFALLFVAIGVACLAFPQQLLRLYTDSSRGHRHPIRRVGETAMLLRAVGALFILFGGYSYWSG